ncbi:SAM hydrolase/SAM-dependent halogenase family protein [Brumimicrobium mesophilum]|uniref:SAM hydrolase/SAM-dependent halogenase family protein n=1 Tax=Brumimicrobium mesophilum TaxID=392717 RepID=UPI000D13F79F|nr:SAM-dependent chlorinase/fluorinase [Brumimicrobium mesophilum]
MGIITLTTDMGLSDYYVASLKGKLLSLLPTVQIIDISHFVSPFKITQAAHLLKNCINDFPENTVHIIGVDAEPLINFNQPEESIYPTIIKFKGQYFLGADNGFFSLLLGSKKPEGMWRLEDVLSRPELMNFPTKNILVPAACKIIDGTPFENFCSPVESIRKAIPLSPVIDGHTLKGAVSYIDHYGNIITNISKQDFQRVGKNIPFVIYFRQKEYYIDVISLGYNEVPAGEKIAIFNDSGYLEIAINKGTPENGGGANSLFGLRVGDIIRIEFTPRGSRTTIDSLF